MCFFCGICYSWDAPTWRHFVCIMKKVDVGYCGKLSVGEGANGFKRGRKIGRIGPGKYGEHLMHTKWRHVGASQLEQIPQKKHSTSIWRQWCLFDWTEKRIEMKSLLISGRKNSLFCWLILQSLTCFVWTKKTLADKLKKWLSFFISLQNTYTLNFDIFVSYSSL